MTRDETGRVPDARELAPVLPDVCPFRGLEPFREADATLFHGRRAECAALVSMVAHNQWTAVVGPSGSGKSSLALAGVVPRVRESGSAVVVVRPAPSHNLRALAAVLLPLLSPDVSEAGRIDRAAELAELLAHQGLAPVTAALLERTGSRHLLIVVDQFDELLAPEASGAEVAELARVLFDDGLPETVRVLTTLRSDALDAALDHPHLGRVITRQQVYTLGRMDVEQLCEVAAAPVDSVPGVSYEPGLVDRILADARTEPGVLPALGLLLELLWQRRRRGLLTHQAYDELGGITGVLSYHAEGVWERHVRPEDVGAGRRLFIRLVRVPWGTGSATRRTAERSELGEDEWYVARQLAGARLLVVGRDDDYTETVEIAHTALITGWPRLAAWLAEDHAFLTWRESLGRDVERWTRSGRVPGLLPAPETLATAWGWLSVRSSDLSMEERAYLEAARVRHRWRRRWWLWAAAVSGGLLIGNRLDDSVQATPATAVAGGVCLAALGIFGCMLWSTRRLLTTAPWHRVWVLALAAVLGFALAYLTGQPVVSRPAHSAFNPSETAQVVTAIGALVSAIGMSAAAVIRAVALLIHARNDTARVRAGLPPAPPADPAAPDQPQGAEDPATQ
ncbi:nSTAND1 domain-containing NTPase [Streptomyces anulatus]|uniref:nSTAND1 domain-containing NTPase n=1 Tax=Streptomyces anulatus TaxID=1892 RepID=UPI0033C16F69